MNNQHPILCWWATCYSRRCTTFGSWRRRSGAPFRETLSPSQQLFTGSVFEIDIRSWFSSLCSKWISNPDLSGHRNIWSHMAPKPPVWELLFKIRSNLNPLFLIQLHALTTSLFKYAPSKLIHPNLTIHFRLHKQVLSMIHPLLPELCPRSTLNTWRDWLKSTFMIKTLPWLTMVPAKVCQNCHKQEAEDGISFQNSLKKLIQIYLLKCYISKNHKK